jgi:hypothetical protein
MAALSLTFPQLTGSRRAAFPSNASLNFVGGLEPAAMETKRSTLVAFLSIALPLVGFGQAMGTLR